MIRGNDGSVDIRIYGRRLPRRGTSLNIGPNEYLCSTNLHSVAMVNVAEYLFTRLRQLGCTALHGLPGDFNLLALDYVASSGLLWVGNCNELNAAYAADAYSRVRGLGAIITTFGVGELSAVNGIAGAFAELAPVVHIVGTPNRPSQKGGLLLHHTVSVELKGDM
jgi:TPP-dependent 2-oxoacid decarboxylase